jgi:hypothetical protein
MQEARLCLAAQMRPGTSGPPDSRGRPSPHEHLGSSLRRKAFFDHASSQKYLKLRSILQTVSPCMNGSWRVCSELTLW